MKNSNFRSPFTSKRVPFGSPFCQKLGPLWVPFLQFLGPLVIGEQWYSVMSNIFLGGVTFFTICNFKVGELFAHCEDGTRTLYYNI